MPTILCIDDYRPALTTLVLILRSQGYEVLATSSAKHGQLIACTGRDIDLVITDFTMPELSGGEVIRAIRQFKSYLPVVLLSGARPGDCGADVYLEKPVPPELLLETVKRLLIGVVPCSKKKIPNKLLSYPPTKPKSRACGES